MESMVDRALAAEISPAATAVVRVAVGEAQRQAEQIVGRGPRPGTPEWQAEAASGVGTERRLAWQLVCLRIELAAGLDAFEEVVMLRRAGATWASIGAAAGITRQSAHERWGARVLGVLDRYGTGQLGGPVADDEPSKAAWDRE